MKNKDVYILGSDHSNTYGLIYSFYKVGILPYLIIISTNGLSWVTKSRFIKGYWIVKTKEEVLEILICEGQKKTDKATILTTSDSITAYLDENHLLLNGSYIFFGCRIKGEIYSWMDKSNQYKLADKHRIPYARTWLIRNNIIPRDIIYPCLTKPLNSIIGNKEDLFLCNDEEMLQMYLHSHNYTETIIQQFIYKVHEAQILGCSLENGALIVIPGMTYKPFTSDSGAAYYLEYDAISSRFPYLDNCKRMLLEIGFSGLFSIEFLVDKEGNYFFLEINLRNDGNGLITTLAGSNLPYLYYAYVNRYNVKLTSFERITKYSMMRGDSYILLLLKNKGKGFVQFMKYIIKTRHFFVLNLKDPLPFLYSTYRLLSGGIARVRR